MSQVLELAKGAKQLLFKLYISIFFFVFMQDAHELLSQCLDQLQDDLNQLNKTAEESQDVRDHTCTLY